MQKKVAERKVHVVGVEFTVIQFINIKNVSPKILTVTLILHVSC